MPPGSEAHLSARIQTLERSCRRLWAALALTLLVGSLSWGLSWGVPNANAASAQTGRS